MLHLTHDANHEAYCDLTGAKFALVKVVGCPIRCGREVVNGMCATGVNPETGLQTVWIDVIAGDANAARYERSFSHDVPAAFGIYWAQETLAKVVSHDRLLKYGFTYDA